MGNLPHKVISLGQENPLDVNLLSFALLVGKCAKSTSLSIKIKTTLAKQEIGQILSFVCKHEEEKYTNGSSMILHYGPLRVLNIIQGAISFNVESLPRMPSNTPFLSSGFQSKMLSVENGDRAFWNDFHFLNLVQALSKHWQKIQYAPVTFWQLKYLKKKQPMSTIFKDKSHPLFNGVNCPVGCVLASKYGPAISPEEWKCSNDFLSRIPSCLHPRPRPMLLFINISK